MYFVAFIVLWWARASAFDTNLKVKWCAAWKPLVFALIHMWNKSIDFALKIIASLLTSESMVNTAQSQKNTNSMEEKEKAEKKKNHNAKANICSMVQLKASKKINFVIFVCRLTSSTSSAKSISLILFKLKAFH